MHVETIWLFVATGLYFASAVSAAFETWKRRSGYVLALTVLGLALAANSMFIMLRWGRLGHGPYVDLRETLASGLWGYYLAIFLACLFIKRIRAVLTPMLFLLSVMVVWILILPQDDSLLPVTYDTYWLLIHVAFGKVFIGCLVVALGLSLSVLSRRVADARGVPENSRLRFVSMPSSESLDELAFRFVFAGFVSETMMLIAGAIWAQNAWGRYWDWDPLEVWSFLTWISAAIFLHIRITRRPAPTTAAVLITAIFSLAFLTFFGVPFLSEAAHQGMV